MRLLKLMPAIANLSVINHQPILKVAEQSVRRVVHAELSEVECHSQNAIVFGLASSDFVVDENHHHHHDFLMLCAYPELSGILQ